MKQTEKSKKRDKNNNDSKIVVNREWFSSLIKETRRHQRKGTEGKIEVRGAKRTVDEGKIRLLLTTEKGVDICLSYEMLATIDLRALQQNHHTFKHLSEANRRFLEKEAIACKSRRRGREFHERMREQLQDLQVQVAHLEKVNGDQKLKLNMYLSEDNLDVAGKLLKKELSAVKTEVCTAG